MDNKQAAEFVSNMWDDSIIPEIAEYIKVPNKSPHFDPDWEANGHMETAVEMLEAWCKTQPIKDMTIEVVRIEGRTPLLFIDIPGQSDEVVLLYGHYDKQPEFSGWDEDLDPWTPVIKDGKLYGRGGADNDEGFPRAQVLVPATELGLLVVVTVQQDNVIGVARDVEKQQGRAAFDADDLDRHAPYGLFLAPGFDHLHGLFHIAVPFPVRIEQGRFVRNLYVLAKLRDDRCIPGCIDEFSCFFVIHVLVVRR